MRLCPLHSRLYTLTTHFLLCPPSLPHPFALMDPEAGDSASSPPPVKARLVSPAAPDALALVLQKLEALELRVAALSSQGQGPAPAPTIPELISIPGLQLLLECPTLPPELRTMLLPLQLAFLRLEQTLTPDELGPFQAAYSLARSAALPQPAPPDARPGPGAPHSRSHSPGLPRGCFLQNGHVFYRARSGRVFDTAEPPPYPCRSCGGSHWGISGACPQNNTWPHPTPGGTSVGPAPSAPTYPSQHQYTSPR